MRLVSWNVAGRRDGKRADWVTRQAAAIKGGAPDVVALQEITRESDPQWQDKLPGLGLRHSVSTTDQLAPGHTYANLVASRWPLEVIHERLPSVSECPEKVLVVRVERPGAPFELYCFHAPTGVDGGLAKVRALESLHTCLARPSDLPRLVCGDFNPPAREGAEGPPITFAQDEATGELLVKPPRWFVEVEPRESWDPRRWARAEQQVLPPKGLIDVYRRFPGHGTDCSWVWTGHGQERRRRYDHVFASPELEPGGLEYRHGWRGAEGSTDRMSDHSGVVARFRC